MDGLASSDSSIALIFKYSFNFRFEFR